jgi:transmembrane 9 superfamily protein 2/4
MTTAQIPFDYYSLPFCKPEGGVVVAAENLGEFLTGDRIENSPYRIYMRDAMHCEVLCQQVYTRRDAQQLELAVEQGYHHNWIIDNLPAASVVTRSVSRTSADVEADTSVETSYAKGFPVGFRTVELTVRVPAKGDGEAAAAQPQVTLQSVEYFLYNHVDVTVLYHNPPDEATNPKVPFT